ncbi:MAG: Mur ligase family protein, partial [Bryobacteraceae bacterium]
MGGSTGLKGAVSCYSIDSRTLAAGDLFFALRGDSYDGHAFVAEVLTRGAIAAVVDRDLGADPRIIRVDNTLRALQSAARWGCLEWGGKIVGVTGSAGKTTTKDIIASMLASAVAVGRTVGNLNNHVGLPLSILR